MVSFNTSYPWGEPKSTWFQIWSSVGAHTPTQQHEHREQKTLRVTFKHPAKYCSWSRLHIQHRPFKHYLRSYSTRVMTVAPTRSFYVWFLISYTHTSTHLNDTFKQMHYVCTLLKWVCGFLLSLSVNMQQCSSPTWFLSKDPNLKQREQNISCH